MLFATLVLAAVAATSNPLPTGDRLAFANGLARRGLDAEAVREYELLRAAGVEPQDEVLFRLAEAYRRLGNAPEAQARYAEVSARFPASRWVDYARLNTALVQTGPARIRALAELDRGEVLPLVRQTALYHLGEAFETENAMRAADCFARAAALVRTNEVAAYANLKAATLLSNSNAAKDRRQALVSYLDLAASTNPRLAEEALFFAAMLDYREGKYVEATALFGRLAARFPNGARLKDARAYAAWSAFLAGKPTEALARAGDAKDEDSRYLKAASLAALARRSEARAAFAEQLAAFPNGRYAERAWIEKLELEAAENDSAAVLKDLSARGDPPPSLAARAFTRGYEAALAVTNTTLALNFARRAAEAGDPVFSPKARYTAGVIEARLGDSVAARKTWSALLVAYPNSPLAADALRARAMEEIRAREWRSAVRSLEELAKRFPARAKDAEMLYWRGVAARGAEDAPEAEKLFRAALKTEPSAEFAREIELELAFLLQKRGADDEAAAYFKNLLETKAVERLTPASLAWTAEHLLKKDVAAALRVTKILQARKTDDSWQQIAACLEGDAHAAQGANDAAKAAWARALELNAHTDLAAKAALSLGTAESKAGAFDEAKEHLFESVRRANTPALISVRAQAYAALAANEEARGDKKAALGYHLLVGTLFDDPRLVPPALSRAAELLRAEGRVKEADDLVAERKKRYGK